MIKQETETVKAFAKFGISLLLFAPLIMLDGWAVRKLWHWFAVPLGAPALTLAMACGVALLVRTLRGQHVQKETPEWSKLVAAGLMGPLVAVGMGALIHAFV